MTAVEVITRGVVFNPVDESTAVAIVVGDELLQGYTLDTNSHTLAQRLRARGVRLARKEVVGDDPQEIRRSVQRTLAEDRPTFIFVLGGIGPTPDDRTYEGLSLSLGQPLEVTREAQSWMERQVRDRGYGKHLWGDAARREPLLRMVRLPRGSGPLRNPVGLALGCCVSLGSTQLFVLPGVPKEFEAMLTEVIEREYLQSFRPRLTTQEVPFEGEEASLYEAMTAVQQAFPSIRLGSYLQGPRSVVLRVTGPAPDVEEAVRRLRAATASLAGALPHS